MLNDFDLELGISGYRYSDLYDAFKLKGLAEKFYTELDEREPVLGDALKKYISARGEGYEKRVESKILTDAAPFLSDFVARLFRIEKERDELGRTIIEQNPIWKYKFFVQRRAIKKYKSLDDLTGTNEFDLDEAVRELRNKGFDNSLRYDEELAVARRGWPASRRTPRRCTGCSGTPARRPAAAAPRTPRGPAGHPGGTGRRPASTGP